MRHSVGLGLRREFLSEVLASTPAVDFWEIAPENWMARGYEAEYQLDRIRERYAVSSHGLSLSIGSPDPLDESFVRQLKTFLDRFNISRYSEHLSYCSANGHLYDLLPIPFTEQAAEYVAARVKRVQDILERPVLLENVSYYAPAKTEITELAFIKQVLEHADCQLLLDVNNVYVNSVNHNYDPFDFIAALPSQRITYGHIAGHFEEASDLLIDTHGADVRSEVYELLAFAYQQHGDFPVLLERDFNIPPLDVLLQEVKKVKAVSQELA
ncbi:DUF692 domain-containing protein [Pseudidiomarina donghaiensis]|uniref:HvfB family MNIO-type RiPP peptide maturase n=1 Tax=Pseudidiomarina donghaiensis TaxID=519452 RepID=UPI003A976D49